MAGELAGKIVLMLVEKGVEDCELFEPKKALEEAGARVVLAGPETIVIDGRIRAGSENGEYETKEGVKVKVDGRISEFDARNFDAIVIPGGWAPDKLRICKKTTAFVKEMFELKRIVASVCHGSWVLVSAGIVKGKKVTGYFSTRDDIENAGGKYVNAPVVVDGNLVTSRIPDDLPVFCKAIIEGIKQNERSGTMSDWKAMRALRRAAERTAGTRRTFTRAPRQRS